MNTVYQIARSTQRGRLFYNLCERRHLSTTSVTTVVSSSVDESFLSLDDNVRRLAAKRPTPLRLADMFKYGGTDTKEQRLRNAQFLYNELPIRIAQRAVDMLTLPHGLSEATNVRQVANMYLQYLQQLQQHPVPETEEQEDAFTDLLQSFVLDRTSIPLSIARGVAAWETNITQDSKEAMQEMEDCLYRFCKYCIVVCALLLFLVRE
jgi:hypothetical protein